MFPVRYGLNLDILLRRNLVFKCGRAQCGRVWRRQNNDHLKNCIKTHEAKWPLDFIGGKYERAGEGQQQL
jgi:hypothetical protein